MSYIYIYDISNLRVNWKPLTKRSQGRPKYRWEDNIKLDICQLKIQNWITCVQVSREMERGRWEGQNFQLKEVQRLEEEEERPLIT